MATYLADTALLPGGWASDVLLDVDADGFFRTVRPGAAGGGSGQIEASEEVAGLAASDDGAPLPGEPQRVRGVVVPGMPNLHSHAFQRGMAGLGERGSSRQDTFWSWRELMYRFLQRLRPEHVEAVAAQLYVEMLRAGYTSVAEFHYLHHGRGGERYDDPGELSLRILAAARRAGIGLTHLPALYTSGGFGGEAPGESQARFLLTPEEQLGMVERLRDAVSGDPDVRVGAALHSLRAVPPDALEAAVTGLDGLDPQLPIHIHVAEQEREVVQCLETTGARPVEWLLDNAPVSERWCLVHSTHLVESEVERLARSGAVVGLCPSTEANLGDGIFPLADFLGLSGRFGIGSDSHVSVSPVEELRWLEYVQRLTYRERNLAAGHRDASSGAILFQWALAGGARASGRPVGALAPGARADWVVLDPEHPTLAARSGDVILDSWIFSGNESPVRDVVVGGQWVVRDRRHARQEEIAHRYREIARALV